MDINEVMIPSFHLFPFFIIMQQLVETIGKYLLTVTSPLLKHPEQAQLRVAQAKDQNMVRFRLVVEPEDISVLIGRNGMTASAIRSLAKAAGEKQGVKVVVKIISKDEIE